MSQTVGGVAQTGIGPGNEAGVLLPEDRQSRTGPYAAIVPLARAEWLPADVIGSLFDQLGAYESQYFHGAGLGWEAAVPLHASDPYTGTDAGHAYEALNSAYIALSVFDAVSPFSLSELQSDRVLVGQAMAYVDSGTPIPPNNPPTATPQSGTTDEDTALSGTVTGSDVDGNALSYALVTSAAHGNVTMHRDGSFVYTPAVNYNGPDSFTFRASDRQADSTPAMVSITVNSVNDAPTDITLSNASVAENEAAGTVVGGLATTDPDAGDTFTYALVSGTGSTDNAGFTISGNQLKTAASFDFETKSSYTIRVRTTDQGGLASEKVLAITVTDVNDAVPLVITGTAGADTIGITASSGQYTITSNGVVSYAWIGEVSSITINTLDGDDAISIGPAVQACTLDGGLGNDSITGGEGSDFIRGDGGNDTIYGGTGNDSIMGNTGDDRIYGQDGMDLLQGGLGADSLEGGLGNDSLHGGDQSDTIYGQEGDDYIEGRGKMDTIYGGAGNDTIYGGAGSDLIFGEDGDDRFDVGVSTVFHDSVDGGAGSDLVRWDSDDVLTECEGVWPV